jgi:peptidoglycan/LPS O-acetylase OafA/YrhL
MPTNRGPAAAVKYRPDIDGLRALAVALVLLDHLGTRFTGGFIGVDVFFVISGYLISSVIMTEMAQQRFSLITFYERRVRRIFPALLVMLAVVSVFVYRSFVPSEVVGYGKSLIATLFSGSNFLFWSEAGYFDVTSMLKPLLHTWSLGVEEQFYIFFPLFLVFAGRWFPSRTKALLLGMTAISLLAAAIVLRRNPSAAFFFAPLRAWELLAGTILSQSYVPSIRTKLARNIASSGGLLLILVPSLKYSALMAFPGLAAIPPVLGAALVIAAGETGSSLIGRLLSWRPVVFVGLISYSLYLWHWPVIVFQNTTSLFFPGVARTARDKLILIGVSLVLGALSWRFVEQPFRKGWARPGRSALFWGSGLALAGLVFVGTAMVATHGWPRRFPPDALPVVSYQYKARTPGDRDWFCVLEPEQNFADFNRNVCLAPSDGKPSVFLIGDSHAGAVWPGLARVYPDWQVLEVATVGCRPMFKSNSDPNTLCRQVWDFIYKDFLLRRHFDAVVIVGRWQDDEINSLGDTVEYVKGLGQRVVVIGPTTEFDMPEPRLVGLAMRAGNLKEIERHRSIQSMATDSTISHLARKQWQVQYISMYEDLCTPQCPVFAAPNVPILFDTDHLTVEGSEMLAKAIRERRQLP